FGKLPFRADPALFFEAMQCWIERTRLDAEGVRRFCANGLPDAVAVLRTPLKGLQDEHVERSLKKLDAVRVWFFLWHVGQRIASKAVERLLLCCVATLNIGCCRGGL